MKKCLSVSTIAGLLLASVSLLVAAPAASAAVPFTDAAYSGYSTGTVVHADALTAGATGPQLADANEAFTGASVASKGTNGIAAQGPNAAAGTIVDEMKDVVQPKLPDTANNPKTPGDRSYARGTGLEASLGNSLPNNNPTIPLNTVRVSAPPKNDDVKQVGPVAASPLAYASLLRGEGHADWNNETCIFGKPISQGIGTAADAQLLGTGAAASDGQLGAPVVAADASTPDQRVAASMSQTVVVPQTDAAGKSLGVAYGLGTETRMTIAPVTLFKGTPNQVTIEVAGEWVLQAIAGGVPGSARIVYAPAGSPTPTTPLIRILQGTGATQTVTKILNTQDLFGPSALPIPLINIPGLATIEVGESPRAIGGATGSKPATAADGTSASAAVDVVRVTLLNGTGADIRVGHMEAKAQVPSGGFTCPVPVSKTSNPVQVSAGQKFTYTITVNNAFDCVLDPVKVVDTIDPGPIKYAVLGATPAASSTATNQLTWDNIGPMQPHTVKTINVDVQVDAHSPPGIFTNTADVQAKCTGQGANGTAVGLARITVPVDVVGNVVVHLPTVLGALLASTGGSPWRLPIAALMLVAGLAGTMLVRRRRAAQR